MKKNLLQKLMIAILLIGIVLSVNVTMPATFVAIDTCGVTTNVAWNSGVSSAVAWNSSTTSLSTCDMPSVAWNSDAQ